MTTDLKRGPLNHPRMNGVGRGWGAPSAFPPTAGVGRGAATTTTSQMAGGAIPKSKSSSSKKPQEYIPGLTPRPENKSPPPNSDAATPKDVPPELVEAFLNGSKNPVSALMEYCSMRRRTASFQEVSSDRPTLFSSFANECTIDGQKFPQGSGKTKKEAKTNAAKIAFTQILGLGADDVENDEDQGTVMYDSRGRKIVLRDQFAAPQNALRNVSHVELAEAISTAGSLTVTQPKQDTGPNSMTELNEYCSSRGIPFTVDLSSYDKDKGFAAQIFTGGQLVGVGISQNKMEAKKIAHQKALDSLRSIEKPVSYNPSDEIHNPCQVAKLCYTKLYKLLQKHPDLLRLKKSFAAFVIKKSEVDPGEVVALGTGRQCLSVDSYKEALDGRSILDSYAITLARRALLKFLHKEVKSHYDGNKFTSLFEQVAGSDKLKVKDSISLHLFINHPPSGDYLFHHTSESAELSAEQEKHTELGSHIPSFMSEEEGRLAFKDEDGCIWPVDLSQTDSLSLESYDNGDDIGVMSCSDKILRWNILGVQGALFSQYLDPVYVRSIIFGTHFSHGHASRAVCCRLYEDLNKCLPPPYRIHHPLLFMTPGDFNQMYDVGEEAREKLSINWSLGDEKIEIINGATGRADPSSPFLSGALYSSRLCKAAFLFRYRDIARAAKRSDLSQARTFSEAKQSSSDYQHAKQSFLVYLEKCGLGKWNNKPRDFEMFEK